MLCVLCWSICSHSLWLERSRMHADTVYTCLLSTTVAPHSSRDFYRFSILTCKGIEWVPPKRHLQPGKDSDASLKNGSWWKMGSPRGTRASEGWEHGSLPKIKWKQTAGAAAWVSQGQEKPTKPEAVFRQRSRGRPSEPRCPYLWASDLVADLVVAPKGSSSSSSSSSSSDSCSFLSSAASETDFWRFLSGSEDSVQIEGQHLDCTIPRDIAKDRVTAFRT